MILLEVGTRLKDFYEGCEGCRTHRTMTEQDPKGVKEEKRKKQQDAKSRTIRRSKQCRRVYGAIDKKDKVGFISE